MRTSVTDVKEWIDKLKKRGISEFNYRDLPEDLKNMGLLRRASFLGKIKEKKKIKDVIVWGVE